MRDVVDQVRRFNRHWTEVLGLLDQGLLETEHSLTEARVIFELAQSEVSERMALRERLGIDASFLTRVLTRLEDKGLVRTWPSEVDRRRLHVALTDAGHTAFAQLDHRSAAQVGALVDELSEGQRRTLAEAMTITAHLIGPDRHARDVSLRPVAAGDLGWVVQRHGEIYADEHGWDTDFEALVARIVADWWTGRDPERDDAWIAEVDGARAGCVFCVGRDEQTAQLRILLVERWARGMGIGSRLVDACITFARAAGYARLVLWTNDVLASARRIYEAAGFTLVDEEPHQSFGHDLVGQNWELDLVTTRA